MLFHPAYPNRIAALGGSGLNHRRDVLAHREVIEPALRGGSASQ
jgi:hypothetical protein